MKIVPLNFLHEIFIEGFYLHSFDLVMEFFHLENYFIDIVNENINFEDSFSFPFSFDIISFVMAKVVVDGVIEQPFFFFFVKKSKNN